MNIELTEKEAKVVVYALRLYSDKVVPYADNFQDGYEICRNIEKRIVSQYIKGTTNPRQVLE